MTVVSLKWRKNGDGYISQTPFGCYEAHKEYKGCWSIYAFGSPLDQCRTVKEFKDLCQCDFLLRVSQSIN